MFDILETINSPADLKRLSGREKERLAEELRLFLISNISQTGGHLASNLGVVELTLALHSCFNAPDDKIVWDVGHQAYVHKIITGRREKFSTLRKKDGLSGFPKRCESVYDSFDTGHSSTSISAALGMARASMLSGKQNKTIAVIGDGSLTGGLAYEALSDAGHSKTNLIVVLNDNNMAISENVGSISKYLNKIRTKPSYYVTKQFVIDTVEKLPYKGKELANVLRKAKGYIKRLFIPGNIFTDLGFHYIGPLDGHNIYNLEAAFKYARAIDNVPVLIHVLTKKGKGYELAEENPHKYHGVSPFDIEKGVESKGSDNYSAVFGETLCNIAKENPKVVAVTPAMPIGSGLTGFAQAYPDRFFDVGIAESHAVTMSCGLACGSLVPVTAVYSSFLQRAYDQILHDCVLQQLHVVFAIDRAGVVGADGATHHGIYDLSYLSHMPGISVLAPSNYENFKQMLDYAVNKHSAPIAIRYPRGNRQAEYNGSDFVYGKSNMVLQGTDVTILSVGTMTDIAIKTADALKACGKTAEVIDVLTVIPMDLSTIIESITKTHRCVVLEDNVVNGGFGSITASLIAENNLNVKLLKKGFPCDIIPHANIDQLYKMYGLDEESLTDDILKFINGVV